MTASLTTMTVAFLLSVFCGSTFTKVIGKEETKENLTLNVNEEGPKKVVSLKGYSILEYKDVSISGKITIDDNGNIVSYEDVVIKGVPAKVKSVSGSLNEKGADITLSGKAGGLFKFEVHYTAKLVSK